MTKTTDIDCKVLSWGLWPFCQASMLTLWFYIKQIASWGSKMQPDDIDILSNKEIPESVRTKIAELVLTSDDREADRNLEREKLKAERRKFVWNTPVVAALAGLLTLSATFVFEGLTAQDATENTITLEQVKNELQESVSRLKQELELDTSQTLAQLEAQAKEREFQYEIVRSELDKEGKTNAERAAVLLFLARAGVLNALDANALQQMAEAQKENPEENIIPQLSSSGSSNVFPPQVQQYWPSSSSLQENEAFSKVYQIIGNASRPALLCNSIRISRTHFATMAHCFRHPSTRPNNMQFSISNSTSYPVFPDVPDSMEFQFLPTSIDFREPRTDEADGIAVASASRVGIEVDSATDWTLTTRNPVVGERLFMVGYAPNIYDLASFQRGLARVISIPVIQRGCKVTGFQNNRVSTDCISSRGMSGAPIFAESDGALITIAAWGYRDIGPTDGPSFVGLSEMLQSF